MYIQAYFDFNEEIKEEVYKFKIRDHVTISKHKKNCKKDYVLNQSHKIFPLTKIKSTDLWTYLISDLNGEEIVGTFYE